ncbi:MAG: TetR family transcriptional regulator [Actinophytocola sp.]|uniref:TetR/AcrR family transcriptional regulator n=1 Tax=Actinophytocola sp. TaxID=1872138 RepID=UPI001320671B|nr:TetR/AcrR family transcriptional regulator [Actinophytocola sp.]MPZ81251.1 TetR family transcriptional regulator [Actinophytocola sp.]
MTRLSRAESQARTRTRLLRTARELFLHDGYQATSLDKVAEAAGFSKGAVYSNFRSKNELCLAVLDEIRAGRTGEITDLLRAPTTEERLRRFEKWAERVIGDREWTALEFEFAVQARRDEELRLAMADRIAAVSRGMESAVAGVADGDDALPPMASGEAAVALLCLGVGLGLFRSIDPRMPVSALVNTVRVLTGVPAAGD